MGKKFNWIWIHKKQLWYLFLLASSSVFVHKKWTGINQLNQLTVVNLIFLIWLVLLLLPLFSEMEILGLKFKREIEQAKSEVKENINDLKTSILDLKISNSVANSVTNTFYTQLPPERETDRIIKNNEDALQNDKDKRNDIDVDDFVSDNSMYLFKVRAALEKVLNIVCDKTGYPDRKNLNLKLLFIIESGIIDKQTAEYIKQIITICNRGIHGEIISPQYIKLVEVLFPKVINELNSITSRMGCKHYLVCPKCNYSGYTEQANVCPQCGFITDEE